MSATAGTHRTVAWDDGAIDFTEADAAEWTVGQTQAPNASGPCPRCDGRMQNLLVDLDNPDADVDEPFPDIICDCGEQHQGAPDSQAGGCGARWSLRIQGKPPDRRVVAEPRSAPVTVVESRPPEPPAVTWVKGERAFTTDDCHQWETYLTGRDQFAAGPCPRCGCRFEHKVTFERIVFASAGDIDTTQYWQCECRTEHPDRSPGQQYGCGASWPVRIQESKGGLELTEADAAGVANARLIELNTVSGVAIEASKTFQEWAAKWLPGVASLQAVLGLASVVVFKDAARALPLPERILAFALIVAAALGAGVALVLGYWAAHGWPRTLDLRNDRQIDNALELFKNRTKKQSSRLATALGIAATSVALLLSALAILWFGAGANPVVKVIRGPGAPTGVEPYYCGELLGASQSGVQIKVTEPTEVTVKTVPLGQLKSIEPGCSGGP